jgi:hypothetical protein
MAYSLKFVLDTLLKQSTAQSSQLPGQDLQYIDAGTVLPIAAIQFVDHSHLKVTFGKDADGHQIAFKGRNTWYIYSPDVQILREGQPILSVAAVSQVGQAAPTYVLKALADTWLKQRPVQSTTLNDDQRQLLEVGTVLPVSSYALLPDDHLKISLGKNQQGEQLAFKGRNTWYVYRPHGQILRDGKVVPLRVTQPTSPPPQPKLPTYAVRAIADTWLKQRPIQAADLSEQDRQLIKEGQVLPISSYAIAPNNHLKLSLGKDQQGQQLAFKGKNTWYVYGPHIQLLKDGQVVPPTASPRQINSAGKV